MTSHRERRESDIPGGGRRYDANMYRKKQTEVQINWSSKGHIATTQAMRSREWFGGKERLLKAFTGV